MGIGLIRTIVPTFCVQRGCLHGRVSESSSCTLIYRCGQIAHGHRATVLNGYAPKLNLFELDGTSSVPRDTSQGPGSVDRCALGAPRAISKMPLTCGKTYLAMLCKQEVRGSIPRGSTKAFGRAREGRAERV